MVGRGVSCKFAGTDLQLPDFVCLFFAGLFAGVAVDSFSSGSVFSSIPYYDSWCSNLLAILKPHELVYAWRWRWRCTGLSTDA